MPLAEGVDTTQSSANSSSVMSSLVVFVRAKRRQRLKRLPSVRKRMYMPSCWSSCFTEHDAEEDGEQCGSHNASLLDASGDGEAAGQ